MSEAAGEDAPAGLVATLAGVYVSPGPTFVAATRRPSFWRPLLAFMAAGLLFNAVWLRSLDAREFARAEIDDSPLADRMSPEQRAEGIERQAAIFPFVAWLDPVVLRPLSLALAALVYLFVFRFFYAAEMTLKQSMAIVCWTFLATALVSLPLMLLVLYLKQDWNVDPRTALQANLTLLLDKASVPRAVYSLAESLDLFSAWMLALLSIGYGAATGRRAGQAAIGVVAVWAIYVVGKAALAAVF
jgi:Yip1-like protein